nr:hypothetical protein BaRGS_022090 [Batillaria attramentaria]
MPTTINTTSMRERLRRVREDISLLTREMLQDLRRETDRLMALWMEPVEVQVWKSDDVEDVVIIKLDWPENLPRVQKLKKEKQSLFRQLKQMKVSSQRQLKMEVRGQQQLAAEKVRGQQKLEAEKIRAEQEKATEREKVKTFYTGIQQKKTSLLKQVMKRIEEKDVLSKLVQQLCEEFDVRLLAIDCGLRFLMDVPVEEWKGVKELQEKLQKILEDALLPKQEKEEVTWTEVTSCSTQTGDADDGQRLVMIDLNNKMVKVADVTNLHTVLSVTLKDMPLALALLHDGRVAVTAWNKRLYLLDVSGHPTVVSRIKTARQCWGVSAGTTANTLIVSCIFRLINVDVITYEGKFIHTVIDSNTLRDLKWPVYLNTVGGDLLVWDCDSNTVFRVELATGRVVATLTHPDMKAPRQVCVDLSGNVYIACSDSECVLVMSADGRWRRLVEGSQHGDGPRVRPLAVCVTGSRLVVSCDEYPGYSVVAGYDLKT